MQKINPEQYEPLGYRVLIRDLPVEEKTSGGLILPDQTKTADEFAQQFGVVVSMGALAFTQETPIGRRGYPHPPQVGDTVNYSKYAGGTYQTDDHDNKYRILNDDDILGVITRAEIEAV